MNLEFKPHPQDATKRVCTLPGCMIGGIGATDAQAYEEFVLSINHLEVGAQMAVHALAVSRGRAPIPGQEPKAAPRIVPATILPPVNLLNQHGR